MQDREVVSKLTERQKQCLRLVRRGKDSKSIGRDLGISHHTVNKAVEAAMATLGVSDRFRAAEMLRVYEFGNDYDRLAYEPLGVAEPSPVAAPIVADDEDIDGQATDENRLHDSAGWLLPEAHSQDLGQPTNKGSKRNALTRGQRLQLIAVYALGILCAMALLITTSDSLYRILVRILR